MMAFKDQWRVLEALARQIKDFQANMRDLGFVYEGDWRAKYPEVEGYDPELYKDGNVMHLSDLFFVLGGDERIYRLDLAQPYTRQAQLLVEMRVHGMRLGQQELHEYQKRTQDWSGDTQQARLAKKEYFTDGIAKMLGFEPGYGFEPWRPYSQLLVIQNAEIEQKPVYTKRDVTDEDPDRLVVANYCSYELERYYIGKRWKPPRGFDPKDLYTELKLWEKRMPSGIDLSQAPVPNAMTPQTPPPGTPR